MEEEEDMVWSKDKIKRLAQLTDLTESEVYKWNWEQKRVKLRQLTFESAAHSSILNLP